MASHWVLTQGPAWRTGDGPFDSVEIQAGLMADLELASVAEDDSRSQVAWVQLA